MKTKYIILIIILIFTSCTPKFNPSNEYGELQKVNLKDFEGKWKLIKNSSNIDSTFIKIKISNDTLFKYSSTKYKYKDSLYENFDTIKFKFDENFIYKNYFYIIPLPLIYFIYVKDNYQYGLTKDFILIERIKEVHFGNILLFSGGHVFDYYNYYKRVN